MANVPALRLADRQGLDVEIVVADPEAAELAVTTAGEKRRVDEIAEAPSQALSRRVISSWER